MALRQMAARPAAPSRRGHRFSITPYLFLAPSLLSVAILTLFPIASTAVLAFTNYNLYHFNDYTFVGLHNFQTLLAPGSAFSAVFLPVFVWTVTFAALTTVFNYAAGFVLAVLLNNPRLPERAIYRTLLIVPYAIPSAISILVWQGLLNQSFGAVDSVLTSLHLPSIPWLTDPTAARAAILMVNLWLGFPFLMIVCLGGLQAVPSDIYEAASVDGATKLQQLRALTLPLVFRVTTPAILGTFTFNMTNFNIIYLLTRGNPPRTDTPFAGTTDVLSTLIYNLTLQFHRFDYGAALGIIIFVITGALSVAGFWLTGSLKEMQA